MKYVIQVVRKTSALSGMYLGPNLGEFVDDKIKARRFTAQEAINICIEGNTASGNCDWEMQPED